jgi:hypothetical protein
MQFKLLFALFFSVGYLSIPIPVDNDSGELEELMDLDQVQVINRPTASDEALTALNKTNKCFAFLKVYLIE